MCPCYSANKGYKKKEVIHSATQSRLAVHLQARKKGAILTTQNRAAHKGVYDSQTLFFGVSSFLGMIMTTIVHLLAPSSFYFRAGAFVTISLIALTAVFFVLNLKMKKEVTPETAQIQNGAMQVIS